MRSTIAAVAGTFERMSKKFSGASSHNEARRVTRELFTDELLAAMVDP